MKPHVDIVRFDGGGNRKTDPINVPLSQSLSLVGLGFDSYGALRTFNGISTLNSTPLSARAVVGLHSYKPATMSAQLVAVCAGGVWVATGAATAFNLVGSSQSVFTNFAVNDHVYCDTVQFQDLIFFSDGDTQPYKFNGTEFTRAGISAPTQVLTAVSDAGAGNLTGTYQYVYWGVNSYSAEGDYIATPSTAVTVTNAKVRVNNIPTAPVSHGITTWKVGRNTANAQGVYWYLTDVTNGTTSFTDNIADSSLSELAPVDQGYLRKFKYMVAFAGRLWGATNSDSLLWFSNPNQPEEFPSENFIRIGRGDGLQISALVVHAGRLIVSKSNWSGQTAIYAVSIGDSAAFSDTESWYPQKISDFGGSDSHWGVATYGNYLFHINHAGAFAFNGDRVSQVANGIDDGVLVTNRLDELYGLPDGTPGSSTAINTSEFIAAAAINWKDKVWLSLDESALNPTTYFGKNDRVHVFDYQRKGDSEQKSGAWSMYYNTQGFSKFVIHENKLYGADASGTTGYIFELDDSDANLPAFEWLSPLIKGEKDDENIEKDFRHVFITGFCDSSTVNVTFLTSVNLTSRSTFSPILQTHTLSLTTTPTRHRFDLNGQHHGKWLNMLISDSSPAKWTISKIEFHYNRRGSRNA